MPKMNTPLPGIMPGARPKVLFLGNGVNLNWGGLSWSALIKDFAKPNGPDFNLEAIKDMPSTMQIVAATGDHIDSRMEELCQRLLSIDIPAEETEYIKQLLDVPFDQIITTNYTYEIEKTIDPCYSRGTGRKSTFFTVDKIDRGNDMMLHRFNRLGYNGIERYIWHIHGIAYKPKSIIIGHYYYGKLISQVQSYIGAMMRRYKTAESKGDEYLPLSWVDYFMTGDVYVLGFGMDLSEFDVWWLACCKKRNFPDSHIYYLGNDITEEKMQLMRAYRIEHIPIEASDYKAFYTNALKSLKDKCSCAGSDLHA